MKSIQSINGDVIVDLLTGRPQQKYIWLQRAWLVVLFLGGLYLWGYFLNWGRGPLNFHDWALIYVPAADFFARGDHPGRAAPAHVSTGH